MDEVRSPVIYFERSQSNESSELVAGRLWAELEVTPQTGRRDAAPEHFRQLFREISEWFRKNFRRSQPAGFMIGPVAARLSKKGLVLRGSDPKGPLVKPYR